MDEPPLAFCGIPLKWISLFLLTFHSSWQAFAIKIARSASSHYLNSTAVFFAELLKLVISLVLFALEEGRGIRTALREVVDESRADTWKTLMLGVPALAYAIQNNLIFLSFDKLSAAVQQVTYQLKILTAALLSVTMLGKKVSCSQWICLCVLVLGVVLVQYQQISKNAFKASHVEKDLPAASFMDAVVGIVAVVAACLVSGFAGVFMEKVLKATAASIWLRNAQLAFFGCLMALGGVAAQDFTKVYRDGFTQGYNAWVWVALATMASGGLLVAVVLKYADNILRQFSTALSIIITTVISATIIRDVVLDVTLVIGTVLTVLATFAYNGVIPVPDVQPKHCAVLLLWLLVCAGPGFLVLDDVPSFPDFSQIAAGPRPLITLKEPVRTHA